MNNIMLIGNGGHAKVIKDIILRLPNYHITGYLDDTISQPGYINNVVYDNIENISKYNRDNYFVIAIGDNKTRQQIVRRLDSIDIKFATIIHPSAIIGSNVSIDEGTVVMANVTINADVCIGKHCVINTMCCIEHDINIKHYVHIAPHATLTGNVVVNSCTLVGAGVTVIPNITIGQNVTVGAGSTVINHIADNCTVYGSPAKIKR
ncbi:acetyltransferase [Staphylococcus durrellii]|uniref:acetyltransferase n=1 Tax=Staphylococcus durrellii TaxID=2781773 RepID=UPI00189E2ED3|nr:acetyltransferase [Staphylococcus durrellii]MBF7016781.1 acetyltransferase [Staphylococcus durrellii]